MLQDRHLALAADEKRERFSKKGAWVLRQSDGQGYDKYGILRYFIFRLAVILFNVITFMSALSPALRIAIVVLSCFIFFRPCVGLKALCNRRNEDCNVLELCVGLYIWIV